jgi:hypothetical protein
MTHPHRIPTAWLIAYLDARGLATFRDIRYDLMAHMGHDPGRERVRTVLRMLRNRDTVTLVGGLYSLKRMTGTAHEAESDGTVRGLSMSSPARRPSDAPVPEGTES